VSSKVADQLSEAWKDSKHLAVVSAYEDPAAGARVYEFCRTLSKKVGQNCEITKVSCPFNEFCIPQLREMAADEAAVADLIVISAHHAESLPAEVKSWIDLWLKQRGGRPKVLVGLFDAVYGGDSSTLKSYLKEVADRGKMEFVVQAEEAPV
jgi:hypothetical protein